MVLHEKNKKTHNNYVLTFDIKKKN